MAAGTPCGERPVSPWARGRRGEGTPPPPPAPDPRQPEQVASRRVSGGRWCSLLLPGSQLHARSCSDSSVWPGGRAPLLGGSAGPQVWSAGPEDPGAKDPHAQPSRQGIRLVRPEQRGAGEAAAAPAPASSPPLREQWAAGSARVASRSAWPKLSRGGRPVRACSGCRTEPRRGKPFKRVPSGLLPEASHGPRDPPSSTQTPGRAPRAVPVWAQPLPLQLRQCHTGEEPP